MKSESLLFNIKFMYIKRFKQERVEILFKIDNPLMQQRIWECYAEDSFDGSISMFSMAIIMTIVMLRWILFDGSIFAGVCPPLR